MSHTHHNTHHEFDELAKGLDAALHADLARQPVPVQRPATPAPGGSAGRGPGAKVGPPENARPQLHSMKADFTVPRRAHLVSPLEQLAEVVEEAYRLRQEVEELVASITGEVPVAVGRMQPMGPVCGLLPNVARLAAEIGAVHGQISDRIDQAKGRLG